MKTLDLNNEDVLEQESVDSTIEKWSVVDRRSMTTRLCKNFFQHFRTHQKISIYYDEELTLESYFRGRGPGRWLKKFAYFCIR